MESTNMIITYLDLKVIYLHYRGYIGFILEL